MQTEAGPTGSAALRADNNADGTAVSADERANGAEGAAAKTPQPQETSGNGAKEGTTDTAPDASTSELVAAIETSMLVELKVDEKGRSLQLVNKAT